MGTLTGKRLAVLVTSGVEEDELVKPVDYLRVKGATVTVIVPIPAELRHGVQTKRGLETGSTQQADALLDNVKADDFDGLLIPGGVSPDHLRLAPGVVDFVRDFAGKPIFAIGHGPQLLISARLVKGRTMTSAASIVTDLLNAGLHNWLDKDVVFDGNFVTARGAHDLAIFNEAIEMMLSDPHRVMRDAGPELPGQQAA